MGGRPHYAFYDVHRPKDTPGGGKVSGSGSKSILKPVEDWFKELDNVEQICWAFDVLPSDFNNLSWSTCWYDVEFKMKLKMGELSTGHLQYYNSLAEIVGALFSTKKEKESIKVNDMSPEMAVSELNNFFQSFGNQ